MFSSANVAILLGFLKLFYNFFSFDINPLARHTIWSLTFGGFAYVMQAGAVNQNMVQRYLALPTLSSAKRSKNLHFNDHLIF